jgi:hypothetical protein
VQKESIYLYDFPSSGCDNGKEMRTQEPEISVYFSLRVAAGKMMMLKVEQQRGISGRLVFNDPAITKCFCLLWFDARLAVTVLRIDLMSGFLF